MEISIEKKRAYSEVYELLNLLDIEYIDKIPKNFLRFLEENRDKNYKKNINPFQDISKQNLKKDTIIIFSMLNLKYFADENEKEKLIKLYNNNQKKLEEKYSYDNIFVNIKSDYNNKQSNNGQINNKKKLNNNEQLSLVNIKNENIFQKILKFIRKIFK